MQDNCPKFDVGMHIAKISEDGRDEKTKNLGTYIVHKLADDIRYVYSFETNMVFLEFDTLKK